MKKNAIKICTYQKKAVTLHRIFKDTIIYLIWFNLITIR